MVQILERPPSFGEAIARGLGGGISQGISQGVQFAQQMALQKAKLREDKKEGQIQSLQSIKGTIDQMKAIISSDDTGLGVVGKYNPSPSAFNNRAKIRTLGSDLLTFYKSLFPRGITQAEFLKLERDYIPKPGEPIQAMLGKLDSFQDLIDRKLKSLGPEKEERAGKERFDASNPEHKAKASQLFKTYGNKEKVREALKREFEGL